MRVLVVDDEPQMVELLRDSLQQLGYEAVTATSAPRGLEILDQEAIRVVLTDWLMPGMNGLEFVRRIRQQARQRYTYVIMLTALGGADDYLEGMQAGADDFATKPIGLAELTRACGWPHVLPGSRRTCGSRKDFCRSACTVRVCGSAATRGPASSGTSRSGRTPRSRTTCVRRAITRESCPSCGRWTRRRSRRW
jgi:CheY-like chemotaxis protein